MSGPKAVPWIALGLLIATLGLSALAFGSVETWAVHALRLAAILCVGLLLWWGEPARIFPRAAFALALPATILVAFALFQTLPLPVPIVRLISPRTASVYGETVPAGGGAALPGWLIERARKEGSSIESGSLPPRGAEDRGDRSVGRSLSVYPHGSRSAALAWLTQILFFLAASSLACEDRRRYFLLWGIAGWTGFLGALAILERMIGSERILWLRTRPPGGESLGPFVNPNNFAGYTEMGILVTFGLAMAVASRGTGRLDLTGLRLALVDRAWALPRLILLGGLVLLAVSAFLLSRSRGGLLAFALGLLFLFAARRLGALLPGLAAAAVLLGLAVGLVAAVGSRASAVRQAPFVSSANDPSAFMRLDAYGKTMRVFLDHPISGTGLGTFQWAYAPYQRDGDWMTWDKAHNDYLQLLAETGLVGGALLMWALVVFVRRLLVPVVHGIRHGGRWTSLAVASAVFAMVVHSILDFNLQIPANAALFSTLLGILAAASEDALPSSQAGGA